MATLISSAHYLEMQTELETVRVEARARHEAARKAAKARGRLDFPLLPFECSWAFEVKFERDYRRRHAIYPERRVNYT